MKKVKIMLMSAIVVAAVGGAIAFKAKAFSSHLNCGITTETCTTPMFLQLEGANAANSISYCTDNGTTNCTYARAEE